MSKWEMVRLGDEIKVTSGGTPSRAINEYWIGGAGDTLVPWVKTGDLKSMYLSEVDESITTTGLQNCSAKMFPKDTLLVAMYGATIGACSILNIPASTNQACAALLPNNKYLPAFLYYYFLSIKDKLISMGVGGAQPNISGTMIQSLKIPLPPLDVQHHIADVLNRVGTLIEKRKAQIDKLDLLVKSRFVEMFGDPVTNPMGWERGTVRNIVAEVKYGTSNPANDGGQYPYLRMNNITYSGQLDMTDLKYINMPDSQLEKYAVRKGDVLFNRTNSKELVGKTCVFDSNEIMIIAGYIIRVRTNNRAIPVYLSAVLNSDYGKLTLRAMCKTIIGQANINAQELQDIEILIPPLPLQHRFADYVRATDKSKFAMQRGLDKLELLYKSLMQKCFAGELFN